MGRQLRDRRRAAILPALPARGAGRGCALPRVRRLAASSGLLRDLRAILEHTARAPCPKHEIELEAWSPELASGQPGEGTIEWVTVGTFADAMQAQGPRIRLEAEGIPTVLQGERMGSRSMYAVATGGLKLQVPRPLEADARVLLSQSWTSPVSEDDLDDAWEELAPEPARSGAGS